MEDLVDSLVALQSRLHGVGIPSAVIGAVAVSVWGEPRLTRDVDVKVLLRREEAPRLLELLAPDYTPLLPDPLGLLRRSGILFVQDRLGTRLDLLLADVGFDVAAIRRAQQLELQPGRWVAVCSPEDLVIYKLISTRPRDHADAEGVIRRQGDALHDEYVVAWLRQFETALDDSTLVDRYRQARAR